MASNLVFQPDPGFGRTTSVKAFGYAKVLFLLVMCCHCTFFRVYFYRLVFDCLPAFISGGGRKQVTFCFLRVFRVWTSGMLHIFFPMRWAATPFPCCHLPAVSVSASAVAHKFHKIDRQVSDGFCCCLQASLGMTAVKTDVILLMWAQAWRNNVVAPV